MRPLERDPCLSPLSPPCDCLTILPPRAKAPSGESKRSSTRSFWPGIVRTRTSEPNASPQTLATFISVACRACACAESDPGGCELAGRWLWLHGGFGLVVFGEWLGAGRLPSVVGLRVLDEQAVVCCVVFALSRSWAVVAKHGSMVSVDLEVLSVRELLALWASALRELRERGVIRTFNNPIGDIAEELVAIHYGGQRGSFSQKTWDVRVGDELLQVKALRVNGRIVRLGHRLLAHPAVERIELSDAPLDT